MHVLSHTVIQSKDKTLVGAGMSHSILQSSYNPASNESTSREHEGEGLNPNFRPWSSGLTWRKQPLSCTSLTIPAISAYLFKGLSSIAALTKACRTPLTYQSTRLCPVTRRKAYLRYIRRQISSCHWVASTSFSSLHATAPSRARERAC